MRLTGIYFSSIPDADKIQTVEMDEPDSQGFTEKRKGISEDFLQ
jgi:hypothetical protein